MRRTIEYRGKRLSDNEWIYGFLADEESINNVNEVASPNEEVDPDTIGEYSGVRDCDDNKIFEGDIVECVAWNEFWSVGGEVMEPMRRRMYVDFRCGGFKLIEPFPFPMVDGVYDLTHWDEQGDLKVVGNIYDSKELLNTEFIRAVGGEINKNNESDIS